MTDFNTNHEYSYSGFPKSEMLSCKSKTEVEPIAEEWLLAYSKVVDIMDKWSKANPSAVEGCDDRLQD